MSTLRQSRRTPVKGAAAALIATLALASCQGEPSAGETETSTTSSNARTYTDDEATAALPEADQLSDTLTIEQADEPPAIGRTDPDACTDLYFGATDILSFIDAHTVGQSQRAYSGRDGGYLGIRIRSFDQPVPSAWFDRAGQAVAACTSFTKYDTDRTTNWKAQLLGAAPLGEQSFSVRVVGVSPSHPLDGEVDLIRARDGHTLISVSYAVGPFSQRIPNLAERATAQTLANLADQQ